MFIVNFNNQYQTHQNYVESFLTLFDFSIQIINNHVHRSRIVIVAMLCHLKLIDDDKY